MTETRSPLTNDSLLRMIESHIEAEIQSIETYESTLKDCSNPQVRFLLKLVVEDEHRHHELFRHLAGMIKGASFSDQAEAWRPQSRASDQDIASRLALAAVEERVSAQQLTNLASKGVDLDDGLFGILLELMAMDSQKHALVLSYAAQTMRGLRG